MKILKKLPSPTVIGELIEKAHEEILVTPKGRIVQISSVDRAALYRRGDSLDNQATLLALR